MIPADYRLEHVAAGLIERLDGARRSYEQPERALEAFHRAAEAHADGAVAEWRALGFADDPEPHAAFLRRELVETVLPRFHRVAMAMNAAEASGYGLGRWASPVGRLGLLMVALTVFWVVLRRFLYLPIEWPLVIATLSLPLLPDVLGLLEQRRYRRELEELVQDVARIQAQQLAYEAPAAEVVGSEVRRPQPQRDRA